MKYVYLFDKTKFTLKQCEQFTKEQCDLELYSFRYSIKNFIKSINLDDSKIEGRWIVLK
jgi:hypothetical protein